MKALRRKLLLPGLTTRQPVSTRFLFSLCLSQCLILAACGIQVGTQPYVSDNNVGPQSALYREYQQGTTNIEQYRPAQQQASYQPPKVASATTRGSAIVHTARKQIGTPYRYGGTEPKRGFDCSGLIVWVYQQHGVPVPRMAKTQTTHGKAVKRSALQPGDIVSFRINGGYHTGIYSGNGKFIHSPKTGAKVREESLNNGYWSRHFAGARRVI